MILLALMLGSGAVVSQSLTALSGPYGGDVTDLERDASGNTYAIVSNTLYKSSNNGDSWQRVNVVTPSSGLTLYDLAISGTKLYAVYFNTFFVSVDGGANWTKPATTFPFTSARRLLRFGPDGFIAVYGSDGLFVTKDEGVTWTKALSEALGTYTFDRTVANPAGDLYAMVRAISPNTQFTVKKLPYPGVAGAFLEANWQVKYTSAVSSTSSTILSSPVNSDIYLFISDNMLISQDGGATWPSMKGNVSQTCFWGVAGVSASGTVYYVNNCNGGEIYSAPTPGTSPTWTVHPLTGIPDFGSSVYAISFISSTDILFGGISGAGVFRSTDSGTTLVHKSVGITAGQGRGVVVSNTGRIIYVAGTNVKGYWTSIDGGTNWTFVTLTGYYSDVMKTSNGNILLFGANSSIAYSTDNGASFTNVNQGNADLAEAPGGITYAGYTNAIYSSSNFGATWSPFATTGWPAGYTVRFMAADATYIYVYAYSGSIYKLFTVARSGGTVTELTNFAGGTTILNNLFVADNKLYAIQSTSYFVSADQGSTWTTVSFSGTSAFPISDGTTTGICVARSGTFYVTQDDGLTWNSLLMPSSNSYATSIALDPTSSPANPVYYLSAYYAPALKFTGKLIVDPANLPQYINFNWQPLPGPYGGTVTDLEVHPDGSLYGLSGNQIYKYAGSSWTRLNGISGLIVGLGDLEIDNTGKIYALSLFSVPGQPRLYVSTDGGMNWTAKTGSFQIASTIYVTTKMEKMDDGSLVVLASNGRIFRSTDDGDNFTVVKNTGSATFSIAQPIFKTATYAVVPNGADGVLFSTDNGQNWTARNNGLPMVNSLYSFANLSMAPTGELLITLPTALDANNLPVSWEVFRTSNQGSNWTQLTTPTEPVNIKRILVMPNGDYMLSIFGTFDLYKSTNQGGTWTALPSQGDAFPFYTTIASTVYLPGFYNGVLKSTDNGTTLTAASTGMPRTFGAPVSPSSDIRLIDGSDLIVAAAGIFHSNDFGQTWVKPTTNYAARFLTKGDSIIAYGGHYNLLSTDKGNNWSIMGSNKYFTNITTVDYTAYYATSNNPATFGLFYSNDLINWVKVPVAGLPATFNYISTALDQQGVLHTIISENGTYSYYQIAFETATRISEPIAPVIPQSVYYYNNKIYLYDANGAIFVTQDSGNTWQTISAPAGGPFSITNDYFFIGASNTVLWLSRNGGTSWQSVGDTFVPSTNFLNIIVNEYDGFAYALSSNSVVKKSQVVVMTDDHSNPVTTAFLPANNSTGTAISTTLRITFNEVAIKVGTKKLRIFDLASQAIAIDNLDMSEAVQDGKSFIFTPHVALAYNKTYFITIEPGGFTDIFGNAYAGFNNSTTWRFTTQDVPDTQAPVITFAADALQKGSDKTFDVAITDNTGVVQSKIFYRSITTTNAEASANLTYNAATDKYNATIIQSTFGPMGLEYYFTAADAANNTVRSPVSGYHYSYIFFPTSFNQQIPGGLVGNGGTLSSWRIITIPHTLSDSKVATIFSELGAADNSKWRLITLASQTSWSEYPQNFTSFSQGKGYFINVKDLPSSGLVVEGATTPSNNKASPFAMTLGPGWTQIGNPYPFPIRWSEVLAANGNPSTIGTALKVYTGSYVDDPDDRLEVFEGAFVLNSGSSNVVLDIPVIGSLTGGRKSAWADPEPGSWLVPITVRNNNVVNHFGGVGMHPKAALGVDNLDDFNPPPVEDFVQLNFPHPEHFLKFSTRDVVPVVAEYYWEFEVTSSIRGEAVMEWDLAQFSSASGDLFLYDLTNQRLVNMRSTSHYVVNTKQPNQLRIYYGNDLEEKIKPNRIWLGDAYPNPAHGKASIPFVLPEIGRDQVVRLEVYDVMGRNVATLAHGLFPSGFYQVDWNLDENKVNGGFYLYRLIVDENKDNVFTRKLLVKN